MIARFKTVGIPVCFELLIVLERQCLIIRKLNAVVNFLQKVIKLPSCKKKNRRDC